MRWYMALMVVYLGWGPGCLPVACGLLGFYCRGLSRTGGWTVLRGHSQGFYLVLREAPGLRSGSADGARLVTAAQEVRDVLVALPGVVT